MRSTRVLERCAEGASGQLFLSTRKVHDLTREESDTADVVAQGIPPLQSELPHRKGARGTRIRRQGRLRKAHHGFSPSVAGRERSVNQIIVRRAKNPARSGGRAPMYSHVRGRRPERPIAGGDDARGTGGMRTRERAGAGEDSSRRGRFEGRGGGELAGEVCRETTSAAAAEERVMRLRGEGDGVPGRLGGWTGTDSCLTKGEG